MRCVASSVIGFDLARPMLLEAARGVPSALVQARAQALPFPPETFESARSVAPSFDSVPRRAERKQESVPPRTAGIQAQVGRSRTIRTVAATISTLTD